MLPGVIPTAAGPAEPSGQLAKAVIDRDVWHPTEVLARRTGIEPVRCPELIGQESRQWRLVISPEPRVSA